MLGVVHILVLNTLATPLFFNVSRSFLCVPPKCAPMSVWADVFVLSTQSTVWPEVNKLLGHLNEVVCITSSNDGTLIASACKVLASAAALYILCVFCVVACTVASRFSCPVPV